MPVIEFDGKTTEEAIDNACRRLRISPEELKFEIVSTGSRGIFGLGGQKASIRVTVEEKISSRREEAGGEERTTGAEARGRRPRREPSRPERPRPERRPTQVDAPPPRHVPLPPTVAGPGEDVHSGPEDEVMTLARESLSGILSRMDIEAEVSVSRIQDRIILDISGDNSGLLIGKKGATLDALQFIVNKIVNRTRTEKVRVVADTENYRQRRHQSLIDLAQRMAAKARRNRRPVTISSLSAHDRRVVHLALQEDPSLKTRSRGEGPLKNVVIIPGGKRSASKPGIERSSESMDEERPSAVDDYEVDSGEESVD